MSKRTSIAHVEARYERNAEIRRQQSEMFEDVKVENDNPMVIFPEGADDFITDRGIND